MKKRQEHVKFGDLLEVSNEISILSRESRIKDELSSILNIFQYDVWLLFLFLYLLFAILMAILIDWKKIVHILIDNFALLFGISVGKLKLLCILSLFIVELFQ